MIKFIKSAISFLGLLLLPLLLFVISYIHFDPFQVVKKYSTYNFTPVDLNRDYISTEIFLRNRQQKNYNSFIFGSSRAVAFDPYKWNEHLDDKAEPFVYDATAESLFGIYTKLKFLEKEKTDLNNVFILFCKSACFRYKNYKDHLGIKHPKVSGESWIKFHLIFFKAYCNIRFLLAYHSFLITGKHNIFTHGVIQNRGIFLDYSTNNITLLLWEKEFNDDTEKYYEVRKDMFYKREGEYFDPVKRIGENQMKMFVGIRDILERNHSNYKIMLSPIYNMERFSLKDKEILSNIYGNHLYDFTGDNFITEHDTNWYETFHFRPVVADSIMNIIYSEEDVGDDYR